MHRTISRDSINRDTTLCISLSGRPSNIGTRFHNFLYEELGLDFLYKAFTTTDLPGAIAGVRALGVRGCGVSMPFKEACIEFVDVMHESAAAISSVNTIVNESGTLHAYNTDYEAVARLLTEHDVPAEFDVAVAGSGGMAKAVVAALRDNGFRSVTVVARNPATGAALAEQYGFTWRAQLGDLRPRLLVNTTPIGMAGGAGAGMAGGPEEGRSPFDTDAIGRSEVVFDVVAMPPDTPLIRAATAAGKRTITGAEVIALQAAAQFALYTGVTPSADQVRRASEYSRG
ncbi:shikimate 5-dehydrogenase [Rhodococcus sp. NPDC127528]|uniref:shikimate 5-dehydrogenase n=1 Tax=unclassified Rhodococcus (in: high G+C Gram-positive bacteria) TaxID=192944 RepID=UPI00362C66D6